MWRCSHCGEASADTSDVCSHCGAHRHGAAGEKPHEVPDDFVAPEAVVILPELDQPTSDEVKPQGPPERALTQAGFAAVLLRFLGLCLAAFGIIGGVVELGHLFLLATRVGIYEVTGLYKAEVFIRPAAEFVIGIYFLFGGQWVYDKILTPIDRSFSVDTPEEIEEDDSWRIWTSADGKYSVKAKFMRVTGGMFHLLKEDGYTIVVERSKLSAEDWHWVTERERID